MFIINETKIKKKYFSYEENVKFSAPAYKRACLLVIN